MNRVPDSADPPPGRHLPPASQQEPGTTVTLQWPDEGGLVRRTVLPCGLRILTEEMPTVRSVSFGFWTAVGSRDEDLPQAGATHYLEHLLFKGTRRRTALDISAALESVGGEVNAYTSKEYTCYYARVLDADLPLAVDVVCDLVSSSILADSDIESERAVVLEEIAMQEDDPTDAVHELSQQTIWADSSLGRPILGTVESIHSLPGEEIRGWYRDRYVAENLVVTAAGNLRHEDVVELVGTALRPTGMLDRADAVPAPPRVGGAAPDFMVGTHLLTRPIEQANLVMAVPGICRTDDRRFALSVLNAALGAGMSSRLFQEVRERRGLAYSVYSYTAQYADTGLIGVYAGCQPHKLAEVSGLCRDILAGVADNGFRPDEVARGKGQIRGGLVLGLEDTGSRMSRLGKSELVHHDLPSVGELLARIEAVTVADVSAAARMLAGAPAVAVVGPLESGQLSDLTA